MTEIRKIQNQNVIFVQQCDNCHFANVSTMMVTARRLLFSSLLVYCAFATISTNEKNQWLAFFDALNGEFWANPWDFVDDPCDDGWYGATCDDTGQYVIEVDLKDYSLTGSIVDLDVRLEYLSVQKTKSSTIRN